jgi:SAM-dependent methyltransferase
VSTAVIGLEEELLVQRRAWDQRPFVRRLYHGWYAQIRSRLASVPGETLEVGAGIGTLKESIPFVIATDVAPTRWAERVVDAEELPAADGSLANVVAVDTLHHLPRPVRLLEQAERALAPGGRLVLLEPYGSPVSTLAYRHFHREPFDMKADPFSSATHSSDRPLDANGALPTLLFFRRTAELASRFPDLDLVERRRLACVAYPLSGGFLGRRLLPPLLESPAMLVDRFVQPLAPLLAFRCLIVLQRRAR